MHDRNEPNANLNQSDKTTFPYGDDETGRYKIDKDGRIQPDEKLGTELLMVMNGCSNLEELNGKLAFAKLLTDINEFLKQYYINTTKTDIFEHALLNLTGVKEVPSASSFSQSLTNKRNITIRMDISRDSSSQLVRNLNEQFDCTFCIIADWSDTKAIFTLPIDEVVKHLDDIKKSITQILQRPGVLDCYQKLMLGMDIVFNPLVDAEPNVKARQQTASVTTVGAFARSGNPNPDHEKNHGDNKQFTYSGSLRK